MNFYIKYCVIWGSFGWVITFHHVICRCFGKFLLEKFNRNWHLSRVFFLASSLLICGGGLLVNCRMLIFHIVDSIKWQTILLAAHCNIPYKIKILTNTVNNESLEWLKFGVFGELIKFTKLSSANLLWDQETFNNFVVNSPNFYPPKCLRPDSPNFSHSKLSSFMVSCRTIHTKFINKNGNLTKFNDGSSYIAMW